MPVGTERLDNVTTFDIALFRDFQAGRYRISPEFNLFNITNQNTVTAINTSSGANYGRVANYLSPRIARFAIRVHF